MNPDGILQKLREHGAIYSDKHFRYTSGAHGTGYIDIRAAGHDAWLMSRLGGMLSRRLRPYSPDIVIGPESLGRTLAGHTATHAGLTGRAIWCDIKEEKNYAGDSMWKRAEFSPKFNFGRLITAGVRVAVVDDLITTGESIRLTAQLITDLGGEVVAAGAVVRRDQNVGAEQCGVPELRVLAEYKGFSTFTEQQCQEFGPCSMQVPMVLRPGHGHEWITANPDYPVAD